MSDGGRETIEPSSGGIGAVVLERLARAAGIEIDPTKAGAALRRAEADIPATATRAARRRLARAAESLGLQFLTLRASVREALQTVGPETPLAAFAVAPDESARWHLLIEGQGGRGRLARLMDGDRDDLLAADEVARRIGAVDADEVVEWLVPQAASLLPDTADPVEEEVHHGPPPMRRLIGLLRLESQDVRIVIAYAVGIGLLSLVVPLTAMALVNSVALTTLSQPLVVLCLVLLVGLGLTAVLRVLQAIVVECVQQRLFVRVVGELAYRLPRVRLDAFDRQHGPEVVNRFFDVLTVQKASATLLLDGVAAALQTFIALLLLAAYHQFLLGFDLVLMGSLAFILFGLGRGAVASAVRESRAKYAVAGWIEEMARHPVAFKLNSSPRFALERADVLARDYLTARKAHFKIVLRQWTFALGLQAIAGTALLAVGGWLVMNDQLTLGQLVAAEIVVSLVVASFTKLGKHLETYYDLLAAVDKLGHLIDLPLERDGGACHHARDEGADVRLVDVAFAYDHARRSVLDRFNLNLAPGERVALLGPNGAGKSTLVDLLFGMRSPTQGRIEIDGADLRDLDLESLRTHIAVVKGIEVFEGSVLDNVRMGRDELTDADVRHALRSVGLLNDLHDLSNGLSTRLWTGGAPLSLGQAERLMLARAIAGRPRLLVLDEVLDDMDQEVRESVLPAILGRAARWTLLVITHSREVARLCDRSVRIGREAGEDR